MITNHFDEDVRNTQHLRERLLYLSNKFGGAWTFSVTPFSHQTTFYQADSPSKLPDWLINLSRNKLAFKGQIRGFSPAAVIREQNRGVTCE